MIHSDEMLLIPLIDSFELLGISRKAWFIRATCYLSQPLIHSSEVLYIVTS